MWREYGYHPDIPATHFRILADSLHRDPPDRVRLEWWLMAIAQMIYKGLGGIGELPNPPWMEADSKPAEASSEAVVNYTKFFGGINVG